MLCQNCHKRPANVHFTQKINGKTAEMYLCEQCANEKGQISFGAPLNIYDFFSTMAPVSQEQSCEKCGMSYSDFQKTGKLGCDRCYELYQDKIKPLIKRLHGNIEHTGKIPDKVLDSIKAGREIENLKELLNKAVQAEEYEKAAEIRDRIKAIESGIK